MSAAPAQRCRCGHPLYWCSTCEQYHHQPFGDVEDCVRAGGPSQPERPVAS